MLGKKKTSGDLDMSRQALIWLHPEALLRFMTSSRFVINEGHLPEDTTFHHVYYDQNRQVFALVVISKEFKQLKLGAPIPELKPISFRWWKPEDGIVE
jgi:hypothetical protein